MHISEMRRREDFDAIMAETLSASWSRERGQPVVVVAGEANGQGQDWRYLPRHSAFVHRSANARVRRFLADSIRYTSRRLRRPAQFVAGTLLSTRGAITLAGRPGFSVTPGLERPDELLILPGNQRIRVFDLGRRRTRVYTKVGFDGALMAREIKLRVQEDGPFAPILAHDESMSWFEEPIVGGWCLARCPMSVNPKSAISRIFEGLDRWTLQGAQEVPSELYLSELVDRVRAALSLLRERFAHDITPWSAWLDVLLQRGLDGPLLVGPTHGDCQDGNLMVQRDGQGALIDWEHSGRRWQHYDRMVFALRSRYQAGLPGRMKAFMRGAQLGWHPTASRERAFRDVAIARFLLEDSVFQVEEAARGPYVRVTEGLCDREAGMQRLGPRLEGLWEA